MRRKRSAICGGKLGQGGRAYSHAGLHRCLQCEGGSRPTACLHANQVGRVWRACCARRWPAEPAVPVASPAGPAVRTTRARSCPGWPPNSSRPSISIQSTGGLQRQEGAVQGLACWLLRKNHAVKIQLNARVAVAESEDPSTQARTLRQQPAAMRTRSGGAATAGDSGTPKPSARSPDVGVVPLLPRLGERHGHACKGGGGRGGLHIEPWHRRPPPSTLQAFS